MMRPENLWNYVTAYQEQVAVCLMDAIDKEEDGEDGSGLRYSAGYYARVASELRRLYFECDRRG